VTSGQEDELTPARSEKEGSGHSRPKSQAVEWILAAVSGLLVLGAIVFLVVEALADVNGQPLLSVEVETVEAVGPGYRVAFTVRNTGEATAASVMVAGTLTASGQPDQRSEVTLDYVPAQSENHGGLFFERDPRGGDLHLRVLGYQEP